MPAQPGETLPHLAVLARSDRILAGRPSVHRAIESRQRETGRDRLLHVRGILRVLLRFPPRRCTVILDPAHEIFVGHEVSIRAATAPKRAAPP